MPEQRNESSAASTQPLWMAFQDEAQRASATAARCLDDIDFDSAAYYRGRASAFREARQLAADALGADPGA